MRLNPLRAKSPCKILSVNGSLVDLLCGALIGDGPLVVVGNKRNSSFFGDWMLFAPSLDEIENKPETLGGYSK